MKHALLITAYNEFDCLQKMLEYYTTVMNFDCYVHIDKKSKISSGMLRQLQTIEGVYVVRKYNINWGGYKHPLAFVHLMKIAQKRSYDFYHLISANTFIGVAKEDFNRFFQEHQTSSFVEHINFKGTDAEKDITRWYRFYHFQHIYNRRGKHGLFWTNFEWYFIKLQERLGIHRNVDFTYKGYVYCHLTSEAVSYVLSCYRQYIRMIKYCHVGEEFFFSNILLNSPLKEKMINDALIYDDWSEHRERPAVLNFNDLDAFHESGKLFLRKVTTLSMIDAICQGCSS